MRTISARPRGFAPLPERHRHERTLRARTLRAGIGATALLLMACAPALATPPGRNGDITFRRFLNPDRTHGAIFTIAPDGSGERQLTAPPEHLSDDFPDFAGDGSFVAFHRCSDETPCRIMKVRPDGSGLRRVARGCGNRETPARCANSNYAAISPDNRRIAFVRAYGRVRDDQIDHEDIYSIRTDGTGLRRITRPRSRAAYDGEPQWSPDGRRLVFVRNNLTARPAGEQAVFVVNVDGSGVRRVTPWEMGAGDGPDWSPDGSRILFRSNEDGEFLNSHLYTARPDGSDLIQLTSFPGTTRLYTASFSPDGSSIALGLMGVNDASDVFTMRLDGTALTTVTRTPLTDSAPDWGPAAR